MAVALSFKTKIGIAIEPSWGQTTAPVYLLPVDPPTIGEQHEQILDQSIRGLAALDYAAYAGVKRVEGTFSGPVFPEEVGWFFACAMGTPTWDSAGSAPYTHTFALFKAPPSLSIQDENEVETARYTGCMVSELTLTFNAAEGLLRYSVTILGKQRTEPGSGDVPAEATTAPFRGWHMACEINGVSFGKLIEGEITFRRPIELGYYDGDTQVAAAADAGPLEVTGRATIRFDTQGDYDRYLDKDQESLQITWDHGTGTSEKELVFLATSMDFGDGPAEIDRSGAGLTMAYTFRALYNSTDVGPCKITLKNARGSVY